MTADPSEMLEQYIALHEKRTAPEIVARVARARELLAEFDEKRAAAFVESVRGAFL